MGNGKLRIQNIKHGFPAQLQWDEQELTATGVCRLRSGTLKLNHATVLIEATLSHTPQAGDELLIVNTSASGVVAHTFTLPSGVTWDGTNDTFTLNAPGEAVFIRFLSSTLAHVIAFTGSIEGSLTGVQELTATGTIEIQSGTVILNHATVLIEATFAANIDPEEGDEYLFVNNSASGVVAHTITLPAGVTWDGTNDVITLDAPGEGVYLRFLSATLAHVISFNGSVDGGLTAMQELTATGTIEIPHGTVLLNHTATPVEATFAGNIVPKPGDEYLFVNTSASGTAAHTVTLPGSVTWDGTNQVITLDAPGEAVLLRFVSATLAHVIAFSGSVDGSPEAVQELTATGTIEIPRGTIIVNHASTPVEVTFAGNIVPKPGDEYLIVNNSASGVIAHTVTLPGGATWDGTNTVITLNAPGEAVLIRFITAALAHVIAFNGSVDGGPEAVQELTVTGTIEIPRGTVLLNHIDTIIAATFAANIDPKPGDEYLFVDNSASGTAAHTVTLPSGVTWDGTNNTATLNAPDEALHVRFISATRAYIITNNGSVALSSV